MQRASGGADPSSPLVRRAALEAYQRGQSITSPLRLDDASTWSLLLFCATCVLLAILVASLGKVEVSSLGRGVLRSSDGVRPVAALTSGIVERVVVETGQRVAKGQLLASIDTSDLRAELLEAERELETTQKRLAQEGQQGAELFDELLRLLKRRAAVTNQRIRAQGAELRRLRAKEADLRGLHARGILSKGDGEQVQAVVAQSEQGRLSLEDTLAGTLAQITSLHRDRADRMAAREQELRAAETRLASVRQRMSQTKIYAPSEGVVETVLVSAGDRIDLGGLMFRLGPPDAPTRVVAFLPERDRAFLREGASARLEVDRLPVGEFGSIPARVVRVGHELALAQEITRVLGTTESGEPLVRVDLELTVSDRRDSLSRYLRSGTLLSVRVPLRERRILALVFGPLRRWLES